MKGILSVLAIILITLPLFSAHTLSAQAAPEITTAHHWAILISGGWDNVHNKARYWNDIGEMYKILNTTCSYNPNDIFVLYADGNVPSPQNCAYPKDTLPAYADTPITGAATDANIKAVCNQIANDPTSSDKDTLFVFVTDHGYEHPGDPGYTETWWSFYLWGTGVEMNATTFVDSNHIGAITQYSVRVFEIEECYGGGFIPFLSAPRTIVVTAANATQESSGRGYFDGFCEDFNAAIKGSYPNGTVVDADANGDGKISVLEAFNYAYNNNIQGDTPRYDDVDDNTAHDGPIVPVSGGLGDLGSQTFLARPLQVYATLTTTGIFTGEADNVVHYTQDSISETGSIVADYFSGYVDNGTTLSIDNSITFSLGGSPPLVVDAYTSDQTSFTVTTTSTSFVVHYTSRVHVSPIVVQKKEYPLPPFEPIPPEACALNLGIERGFLTAYLQLPPGYNAGEVDASSLMLNSTISSESNFIGTYNNGNATELLVAFKMSSVSGFVLGSGMTLGNVSLTITGQLNDGTLIEGTVTVRVSALMGDVNCDGKVSLADLTMLACAWHTCSGDNLWNSNADINNDGIVNLVDLVTMATHYGQTIS